MKHSKKQTHKDMKIKRIYSNLNLVCDISKDKVQIEMSSDLWSQIKRAINAAHNWRLIDIIDAAESNKEQEWID